MTEAVVCAHCLARSPADAQFCHACGQRFVPAEPVAQQPASAWGPPPSVVPPAAAWGPPSSKPAAWGPPPGYTATGEGARQLTPGIAVLSVVEVILGIVLLTVVRDYWVWAGWRFGDDDFGKAVLYYGFAFAFLCGALAAFRVAWELWRMRPGAWRQATWLACGLLVVEGISAAYWGEIGPLDVAGFGVEIGILVFLNLTSVRALFGRAPLGGVSGSRQPSA